MCVFYFAGTFFLKVIEFDQLHDCDVIRNDRCTACASVVRETGLERLDQVVTLVDCNRAHSRR